MAEEVTDRTDPRLGRGVDETPVPQNAAYLVLSAEERAKGFVRPVRRSYIHVGPAGPAFPVRDLTDDEQARFGGRYVKFEEYPPCDCTPTAPGTLGHADTCPQRRGSGRFWKQEQLDAVGKGCQTATSMSQALAETYAANPNFYGATYCVACSMHRPVGRDGEFVWEDGSRVGT